jgi:hypothetical protein
MNILSNIAALCGGIAFIGAFVMLAVWLIKTIISAVKGN